MSSTPSGAIANASVTVGAITTPLDKALTRMEARVRAFANRPVVVNLNADMSALTKKMADMQSRMAAGNGSILKTALAVTGIGRAADYAARMMSLVPDSIQKAVEGASNLTETIQKTTQVFGANTLAVMDAADDMASRFGTLKSEFLDSASNLGLIGKASGLTGGAVSDLSIRLTKLALDTSSFFNTPILESLQSFRSGLVGEAEPMRRFGVLLSEAAVKNEALALGLARSKGELTEGAKVQARASIIIKQLADAQGDLERTSNSLANRLRANAGRIENALTAMGLKIMPVFQGLATVAEATIKHFSGMAEGLGAHFEEWMEYIGQMIKRVSLIWTNFDDVMNAAKFTALAYLQKKFENLAETITNAWNYVRDNIIASLDAVNMLLDAAGAKFQEYLKAFDEWVSRLVRSIGAAFDAMFKNTFGDLMRKLAAVLAAFPTMIPIALALIAGAGPPIPVPPVGGAPPPAPPVPPGGPAPPGIFGRFGMPAWLVHPPAWVTRLIGLGTEDRDNTFAQQAKRFTDKLDMLLGVNATKRWLAAFPNFGRLSNVQKLIGDNRNRNLGRTADNPFGPLGAGQNTLRRREGESDNAYRRRFAEQRAGEILRRRRAQDAAGRPLRGNGPAPGPAADFMGPPRLPETRQAFAARIAAQQARVAAERRTPGRRPGGRGGAFVGPPQQNDGQGVSVNNLAKALGGMAEAAAKRATGSAFLGRLAGMGVGGILGGFNGAAAAAQRRAPRVGRRREPRRGFGPRWGMGEGGPDGAFSRGSGASQMIDFQGFHGLIMSNIQNRGAEKDESLDALRGIYQSIGTKNAGKGSNSVLGTLLAILDKKPEPPGAVP